jgi:hypothetical protein
MGNGEWAMSNGEWAMGNGEWAMSNGEWAMSNGEWAMVNDNISIHHVRISFQLNIKLQVRYSPLPIHHSQTIPSLLFNIITFMKFYSMLFCLFVFEENF